MRALIWQWGRRGAGPRIALEFAEALRATGSASVVLSLSRQSEIMLDGRTPDCDLPIDTYSGVAGVPQALLRAPALSRRVERLARDAQVDVALCGMPAMLDFVMDHALRRAGVPFAVVVHDATPHSGDGLPFQHSLQQRLIRHASALIAPSKYVGQMLRNQPEARGKEITVIPLPPLRYGCAAPPRSHGGMMRLLFFGRLLPYKGLDLLASALRKLPSDSVPVTRIVGQGHETSALATLRAIPNVTVENRWVPEQEVEHIINWSDALVLPYKEASQSGAIAVALACGRPCIVTCVGGLPEQVRNGVDGLIVDPTPEALAGAIHRLSLQPIIPPIPIRRDGNALLEVLRDISSSKQ